MESYGPLVLRAALGLVFAAHGMQKLFGTFGGGGLAGTATHFDGLGLSPAFPLAIAVGITEFAGGLMLLSGLATRLVSLALVVVMLGAIWKVHLAHGFFLNWAMTPGRGHGIEFNLVMIAGLLCLALSGPGAFSIDYHRARSAEAYAAGRARLRGKL
jgi:putative oxidoreductase